MKFTFTDKQSYLKWRQQWREQYAELSANIRALKRARKQYLRNYERYETPNGKARRLVSKGPNPEFGPTGNLGPLRFAASHQMELLTEAKVLSWQLKLAAAATPAVDAVNGVNGVGAVGGEIVANEAPASALNDNAPMVASTGILSGIFGGFAKLLKA